MIIFMLSKSVPGVPGGFCEGTEPAGTRLARSHCDTYFINVVKYMGNIKQNFIYLLYVIFISISESVHNDF